MSITDFRRSIVTLPSISQESSSRGTMSSISEESDDGTSPTIDASTSVRVTIPCSSPYSSTISANCWRALRKLSSRCVVVTPSGTNSGGRRYGSTSSFWPASASFSRSAVRRMPTMCSSPSRQTTIRVNGLSERQARISSSGASRSSA